jgi:hypothetical protein
MFVLHFVVMLGLPYLCVPNLVREYKPYIELDLFSARNLAAVCLTACLGFLAFLPLRCGILPDPVCLNLSQFAHDLVHDVPVVLRVIVGVYFLWRELGNFAVSENPDLLENPQPSPATYGAVGGVSEASEAPVSDRKSGFQISGWRLYALAVAYASYHVVLFSTHTSVAFVAAALFGLSVLGWVLTKTREMFGFSLAAAVHAGVDAAAVLVLMWELRN